jgi:hydroxyacylglutathione hydrolase
MPLEMIVIDLGGVNCYLVKTAAGYILIDTGFAAKRSELEKALQQAGCRPGNLSLVILTHGDSDHADNAAYLQNKFGAKIAIHAEDAGMLERGDMSWNRKAPPDKISFGFRMMMAIRPLFSRNHKFEVCKADIMISEDFALAEYGLAAQVLHLPGHSKGSLGILTAAGDLFCGDLLYHFVGKPTCLFISDLADFNASLNKLQPLNIKTIYPGHGKPFAAEAILQKQAGK